MRSNFRTVDWVHTTSQVKKTKEVINILRFFWGEQNEQGPSTSNASGEI